MTSAKTFFIYREYLTAIIQCVWAALKILVHRPQKVVFVYPYVKENPYQKLLYNELPQNALMIAIPPYFISLLTLLLKRTEYCFHLHWVFTYQAENQQFRHWLLTAIDKFKKRGGTVIWTVHNAVSHNCSDISIETSLYQQLANKVDHIHLHYPNAKERIESFYTLPEDKIIIAPHGNYIDLLSPYFDEIAPAIYHTPLHFFFRWVIEKI